jgi:hypothetical protein
MAAAVAAKIVICETQESSIDTNFERISGARGRARRKVCRGEKAIAASPTPRAAAGGAESATRSEGSAGDADRPSRADVIDTP